MFFWGGREGETWSNTSSIWKQKACVQFSVPNMAKRLKKCDVLPKEKQKPSPPNKRGKRKCDVLPKEKQKPSPPNKREKGKCDVLPKEKTKTMTTQQKGKGSWLLLLMGHMKKD
jgi:hypothetical protein